MDEEKLKVITKLVEEFLELQQIIIKIQFNHIF